MSFALFGAGTAVPPGSATTQAEALAVARRLSGPAVRDASWLPAVYSHSGIDTRHQVLGRGLITDAVDATCDSGSPFLPDAEGGPGTGLRMQLYAEAAPPLALAASADALRNSGVRAADVTHLITVSCTGFAAPGVDRALITGLGLPPTVERTNVGFMGCHGALNGLRVARAFAGADPSARILLCAVELCSLHYYSGDDKEKAVANAIFADGAAALVGGASDDAAKWRMRGTGSCLLPETADAMSWTVGDRGFEMGLSRRIPALIAQHLRPWLEGWLAGFGLTVETVGSWCVHPGGPKIVAAVEEGLSLPAGATAASRAVYRECGNMSSPTVLFILDRLVREGAARPCVMLGFGPGLTAEAALWG